MNRSAFSFVQSTLDAATRYGRSASYGLFALPVVFGVSLWQQWNWLAIGVAAMVAIASSLGFACLRHFVLARSDRNIRLQLPLADALDSMSEGILVIDSDQRILLANRSLRKMLGAEHDDADEDPLAGKRVMELPWQNELGETPSQLPWTDALRDGTCHTGALIGLMQEDGNPRKFLANATLIDSGIPQQPVALVTLSDVTAIESRRGELTKALRELERSRDEIRRQNSELQQIANRDPLTGCRNRRGFFDAFEALWKQGERYDHPLACLMVDIDHFKSINDTYGHAKGDAVLSGVARLLQSTFRDSDLICRYGGEEFCLALPEQSSETARRAAERFRLVLEKEDFDGLRVTASIGVSTRGPQATDYEALIDQADQALYQAKRSGRNCTVLASGQDGEANQAGHEGASSSRSGAGPGSRPAPADSAGGDRESPWIPPQAVTALHSALAFRDPVTAEHSSRVASMAVAIGEQLMSARELRLLETAALLHDIGKIGVPDSILLKPGQLSAEEWEVMHRQERIGVEIVRSAFASPQLAQVLKLHGANFQGKEDQPGMPCGEEIPLAARIISVCNAFDAMTHDRSYRKGMPAAAAYTELRAHAGRQFDPDLVERLIEHHQQVANERQTTVANQFVSALQLGGQIEQIVAAFEELDLPGLQVMSNRLADTAQYLGVQDIATAAADLVDCIEEQREVEEVLQLTKQLLEICQRSQQSLLTQPDNTDESELQAES